MKNTGTERQYLCVVKDTYDRPIANTTQRGEMENVSSKPRNEMQLSFVVSLIPVLSNSAHSTRVIGKRKKWEQTGDEEAELHLC